MVSRSVRQFSSICEVRQVSSSRSVEEERRDRDKRGKVGQEATALGRQAGRKIQHTLVGLVKRERGGSQLAPPANGKLQDRAKPLHRSATRVFLEPLTPISRKRTSKKYLSVVINSMKRG